MNELAILIKEKEKTMREMKEIKLGDTFYVLHRNAPRKLKCVEISIRNNDSGNVVSQIRDGGGTTYSRRLCFADMYEFLQWADDEACKILKDDDAKKKFDERIAGRKKEIENENDREITVDIGCLGENYTGFESETGSCMWTCLRCESAIELHEDDNDFSGLPKFCGNCGRSVVVGVRK